MLDKQTIEIVKSTIPVLRTHGETITKEFYKIYLMNIHKLELCLI